MAELKEPNEVRVVSLIFSEVAGYGSSGGARLAWTWRAGEQTHENEAMELHIQVPRHTDDSAEWLKMVLGEVLLKL